MKEQSIFLSVIIPTYNNERTISQCIKSVLYGCPNDVEVVIIDDGSTDNTAKIIKKIQSKNTNIIYFYQENQGASVARNTGIRISKGKYVMFLDGDDRLVKNSWNIIDNIKQNDNDAYFFDYVIERKSNFIYHKIKFKSSDVYLNELINVFTLTDDLNSPWAKVFNRKFIDRNNIRFPIGIEIGEDAIFIGKIIEKLKKAQYLSEPLIVYNQNESQATRKQVRNFEDQSKLFEVKNKLAQSFLDKSLQDKFYIKSLGDFLSILRNADKLNFDNLCKNIKEYNYIQSLLQYNYLHLSFRHRIQLNMIKHKWWNILYLELKTEICIKSLNRIIAKFL